MTIAEKAIRWLEANPEPAAVMGVIALCVFAAIIGALARIATPDPIPHFPLEKKKDEYHGYHT